ncbi:MAG: AMP-binding protein, partial [Burkholderiales bacterium]
MHKYSTLNDLLNQPAGNLIALRAPQRDALTYDDLRRQIANTINALNKFGIGRNDRVAIVLPNGPDMGSAFVGVACGATAAPLNPAYRADEFEFYMNDLKSKALLVEKGSQSPAVAVAEKLGVMILELIPGARAGEFTVVPQKPVSAAPAPNGGAAQADDVALILHTSGTTSRPTIVPLSHRNVSASAQNIRDTLALTEKDCGMNIMPLFHIHGLIAGMLAPLAAGGSIYCTQGFNALKFFGWMTEAKPTWYTAVPTMHQTIVARAAQNQDVIKANPLRFMRSSSSSMPPQVIAELEAAFGAPLIESYGMTEDAHQMASNPLPPKKRIPGSVGLAAGPEVEIMD